MERGEVFFRLRIERVDRDGASAEPLIEDRLSEVIEHNMRPKVDEQERANCPCHDHERTESEQMFVFHSDVISLRQPAAPRTCH